VGCRAQERVHRADRAALIARFGRLLGALTPFRVALLATLAIVIAYLPASRLGIVRELEGKALDLRLQLRPPLPPSESIVLVLIDDRSIHEVGRWPWSRSIMAEMTRRLVAAGARTIAFDLLFAEPESSLLAPAGLAALRRALAAPRPAVPADLEAAIAGLLDNLAGDQKLAREIAGAGNCVLPFSFILNEQIASQPTSPPPGYVARAAFRVVQGTDGDRASLPLVATGLLAPLPELGTAASALGHVNLTLDRDGAARFEYPVAAYGADAYPSFSLEIARRYLGVPRDGVRLELGRGIALGDRFLPTDEAMRLPVNYRPSERFPRISAARLLAGDLRGLALAGKIVLIGGAAAGIGETFLTPFSTVLPSVARHAMVVDSIVREDFLIRRDAGALLDLGLLAVGGLVIGWLAGRRGLPAMTLGFAALGAGFVALNLWTFLERGVWLNLFLPLLALAAIWAIVLAYNYFIGQRQERLIRAAFKHYLSPDLVEQVARDPSLLRLGGEQRELTVLFADVRDSTRLAGALAPARFAELLNQVLTVLTAALFEQGGMLDKFTGDGLVAVFGAPLAQPDHALRACRAALAMQAQLQPLQARWARPDLPPLEVGIGINSGPMIIGNMGSRERFSYTVIGDEAHLGARLEAANKDFRTRILISEATWRAVAERLAARELDVVTFRGIDRPIGVFELLGERPLSAPRAEQVEVFAAGLAAYRGGQWATAAARFDQVLALAPDDRPSQLYLERCRARLAAASPGERS
jgi:adenylate cyclase